MKKILRPAGFVIAALLAAAVIYLAAVLMTIGEQDEHVPLAAEPGVPHSVRVVHDTSAQVLANAFGAEIYLFPENRIISGVTGNAVHAGRACATLTITFENGEIVSCVRPASAAPLIRPEGMEVLVTREVSVCNLPAQISRGGDRWCAVFSGEEASYCVIGAAEDLDSWLQILADMTAVSPSETP